MRPTRLAVAVLAAVLSLLASHAPARAQDDGGAPLREVLGGPRAKVMLLGVFHFQDAGLDSYKPRFPFDVLAPGRQREVEEVVERVARFQPTRVAVEQPASQQPRLDSLYAEYAAGRWTPRSNEIYQIGFRLAKRLGHAGVHAADARRRWYADLTDSLIQARARELGQARLLDGGTRWDTLYTRLYEHDDSLKTVRTLRETFLYINSPARVRAGHGAYLTGSFGLGAGDDYLGADMRTAWYNRNLRIFENLRRLVRSPEERIVLVVGAGHLPILRHLVESSPELELVEVSEYLGGS
ncbi:MAG TPA: DUF5694 domain-containing protein [Longimicrobium sp.]|nr:DUF5694 domain-containing protein [Longimicrobium sp.]